MIISFIFTSLIYLMNVYLYLQLLRNSFVHFYIFTILGIDIVLINLVKKS